MYAFNIGDQVQWTCKPRKEKPFIVKGMIVEICRLGFGKKKRTLSARVQVNKTSKYYKRFKRLGTAVMMKNLTLA